MSEVFNTKTVGMDFALAGITTALLLMDMADHASVPDKARCIQEMAREAYDTALQLLQELSLDATQQKAMDDKLGILKTRLKADRRFERQIESVLVRAHGTQAFRR